MFYSKLKHTDWSPWWCTLWAYRCHNVRVVSVLHSSCVVNDNWSMTIYWTRQSGPASQLVQTSPLNLGSYQTYSYVAVPVKINTIPLRTLIASASYHWHSDHISFVSLALWSHQLCITSTLIVSASYHSTACCCLCIQRWRWGFRSTLKPGSLRSLDPLTWNLGSITLPWLWCLDYKFSSQSATYMVCCYGTTI